MPINKILEEFDKNTPKTDGTLLDSKSFSDPYKFGYKFMQGGEIFTVTDYGNIKSFLISSLITVLQGQVEGLPEKIIPVEIPHGSPYISGYNQALSEIKYKLLSDIANLQELMK